MKKFCNLCLAVVFATICLCAFVGCRSSKAGVYKFYSMDFVNQTYKVGDKYLNATLTRNIVTVELKRDGSYSVNSTNSLFSSSNGTWAENEKDKDMIDITVNGVTSSIFCDGKELRLQEFARTMIFTK